MYRLPVYLDCRYDYTVSSYRLLDWQRKGIKFLKERSWSTFIIELFMAALFLFFGYDEGRINEMIVFALIIVCLLSARLLISLSRSPVWPSWVCAAGCVVAAFLFGQDVFLALCGVLVYNLASDRVGNSTALGITLTTSVLLAIIFPQVPGSLLSLSIGIVLVFMGNVLIRQLGRAREELNNKDERLALLGAQLENQRSTIGTIEQQGRQAERNRIAARIHDKVGHGITGSILILEAARLQMDKDPENAMTNIDKATENLRNSVDEIRRELRDERSVNDRATLAGIALTLDEFSRDHEGIATEFVTEGLMLEAIPQSVLLCIYECLQEILTNVLKHSDGNRFRLFISLQNRLVYVEFSDNGTGGKAAGGHMAGERAGGHTAVEQAGGRPTGERAGGHIAGGQAAGGHKAGERAGGHVAGERAGGHTVGGHTAKESEVIPGIGLASIQERVLMNGGKVFFSHDPQGFQTRMTFTLRGQK